MQIKVIIFGQLTDITGAGDITIDVEDTHSLVEALQRRYPAFASSKYAIAVDKRIVNQNTPLSPNNTVALLPPFSGG